MTILRRPLTDVLMQDAAQATGNGTALKLVHAAVGAYTAFAIQVDWTTGTGVGTVTFEGTVDDSLWVAIGLRDVADNSTIATTASNGGGDKIYVSPNVMPLRQVRARISAYTSGSITVTARLII